MLCFGSFSHRNKALKSWSMLHVVCWCTGVVLCLHWAGTCVHGIGYKLISMSREGFECFVMNCKCVLHRLFGLLLLDYCIFSMIFIAYFGVSMIEVDKIVVSLGTTRVEIDGYSIMLLVYPFYWLPLVCVVQTL